MKKKGFVMDRFLIEGGKKLSGKLKVRAAKNAVLPLIAASLMADDGETILHNIPAIQDVATMMKLMGSLGIRAHLDTNQTLRIDASELSSIHADYDLVRKMRASVLVMGALLGRMGRCEVSLPGGCNIGARPIDQHLKGLEQLGCTFEEVDGYIVGTVGELIGNDVYFDRPTHTGTENVLTAAVLARGRTDIYNASCEPEIKDVADFLNLMGANIKGAGTPHMVVEGVESLSGVEYNPMGDRLEAGTYLFATMATGGNITVEGIKPENLGFVLYKMKEMGAEIEISENSISLSMLGKPLANRFITVPFPGFPTDLQPMAMAATALAEGTSLVRETIFENRFTHAQELRRMGADIMVLGDRASVRGIKQLRGAKVMASDIRGGAGLVIAGLAAKGKTEILRVYHIDRGYEMLEKRLESLGAKIERISS